MARVFLSYRRADGRYAVGWIAERLRRLDEVTDVATAFRDGELRCGDDFPAALAQEIETCDVLVAVIGPNWLGRRADGNHRITDPADWVGKEIATALAGGKRVLPVLVGGAEPLVAADLGDALRPLANLHSVTFDDGDDLEDLVEHLRSHLHEIDRARATVAGLDAPVELTPYRVGPLFIALAALAAGIGAIVGWGITRAFVAGPAGAAEFGEHAGPWTAAVIVQVAFWGAGAVLGWHFFWQHFRGDVRINWKPVLYTYTTASLLLAWMVVSFGASAPIRFDAHRTWLLWILPVTLLAPWFISSFGTAWTTSNAAPHELGRRTRVLAELGRASRVSVIVIGITMVLGILAAAGIDHALRECDCGDTYQPQEVIALGAALTVALVGVTIWGRSRLRQASIELDNDLRALAPEHRRHAEPHLVDDSLGLRGIWQVGVLVLPLLTAIAVVILA